MTSLETKLRTLASANAILAVDLGTSPFRWYDRRLVQGALAPPNPTMTGPTTCVRVLRVSTIPLYSQGGLQTEEHVRLQIDVIDYDPETARQVAADIDTFLAGVSFMSATPTNITQAPNFKLGQRAGMEYQLDPPAYVETLDYRVWNRTNLS